MSAAPVARDGLPAAGIPDLRRRLWLVALTELVYFIATRVVIHYLPWTSIEAEATRTVLRLASAAIDWQLLRPLILSRQVQPARLRRPAFVIAMLLLAAEPLLFGSMGLEPGPALFFAVVSLPVGIKEEILFRGILQNLAERRLGTGGAIVATNLVFVAWHVGVLELTPWMVFSVFVAGVILGCTYAHSGSIAAVVAIHAGLDALHCFTPLPWGPLPLGWAWLPLLLALAAILHWRRRC